MVFICPHYGQTVADRQGEIKAGKGTAGCRKGTYRRLLQQYEVAQENNDLLFLKETRKLQLLNEKRQNKENDRWGGGG